MELLSDIHKTGGTILFVTHNPELTRYATRVVYMHDGAVIHDEKTVIGEVAATARRIMFTVPTKTEEDDLAGVSMLMKHVPDASTPTDEKSGKKTSKKKTGKTKVKKSRGGKK
jgi:putative ABC transport system ATP-binding protein